MLEKFSGKLCENLFSGLHWQFLCVYVFIGEVELCVSILTKDSGGSRAIDSVTTVKTDFLNVLVWGSKLTPELNHCLLFGTP